MKLHFLYKVRNTVTGCYYIGIYQSDDIMWCNPYARLSDLKREDKPSLVNMKLVEDMKKYGLEKFVIEVIHASGIRSDIEKMYTDTVTPEFLLSKDTYNNDIRNNPEVMEANRQRMIEINKKRKEQKKAKNSPRFGNNSTKP